MCFIRYNTVTLKETIQEKGKEFCIPKSTLNHQNENRRLGSTVSMQKRRNRNMCSSWAHNKGVRVLCSLSHWEKCHPAAITMKVVPSAGEKIEIQ